MVMVVVTHNVHHVIVVAAPPQNTTYKNCTTTNVQWCMHTQNAAAATWGNLSRAAVPTSVLQRSCRSAYLRVHLHVVGTVRRAAAS